MKLHHFSAVASLAGLALAQGPALVLPLDAAAAKPAGGITNTSVFFGTSATATVLPNSHTQLVFDVADIALPTATWTSLSVRRPQGSGTTNTASGTNLTLIVSVGPNTTQTASSTFASNLGTSKLTAFTGPISLPTRPDPTQWPAPWETPIPFTSPFVYFKSNGTSIVVDFFQTGNTGTKSWELEATAKFAANRSANGPSQNNTCKFFNGQVIGSFSSSNPTIGATWTVDYNVPSGIPGIVGFGAIGFAGVGGTWNGLTLPIDLGVFGAPGCTWNVSVEATIPMASTTSVRWSIPIPKNPGLIGQSFYDHTAFRDLLANPWGIVTGISNKWTIGHPTTGNPGTTVAAVGNGYASTFGVVTVGQAATVQLN